MKKIIIIAIAVLFVFSGVVFADETSLESNIDVKDETNVQLDLSSHGDNIEAPNLLTPTKIDGAVVTPLSTTYIPSENVADKDLPEIYTIEGWKVLHGPPFQEGIPVSRMKSENDFWLKNHTTKTGFYPEEKAIEDDDLIIPLQSYPVGVPEISHSRVFGKKDKVINSIAMTSVFNAWKEGNKAKYILILYNPALVSAGNLTSHGLTALIGAALSKAADTVGGLGGGLGGGDTESYATKRPMFMTIAFARGPGEVFSYTPPNIPKKEEKAEVEEEVKPIADIEFGFNEFKITPEEMEKIKEVAKRISEDWQNIITNFLEVRILGGASKEGTVRYNLELGEKRAKSCALALSGILIVDYNIPDEQVQGVVKVASVGENEKEYEELRKNRRAYFLLAKRI